MQLCGSFTYLTGKSHAYDGGQDSIRLNFSYKTPSNYKYVLVTGGGYTGFTASISAGTQIIKSIKGHGSGDISVTYLYKNVPSGTNITASTSWGSNGRIDVWYCGTY